MAAHHRTAATDGVGADGWRTDGECTHLAELDVVLAIGIDRTYDGIDEPRWPCLELIEQVVLSQHEYDFVLVELVVLVLVVPAEGGRCLDVPRVISFSRSMAIAAFTSASVGTALPLALLVPPIAGIVFLKSFCACHCTVADLGGCWPRASCMPSSSCRGLV